MSNSTVISLRNIVKAYQKYSSKHRFNTLKSAFIDGSIFRDFKPEDVYLAVNNVSLDIKKGQTIGIIGENGSGKSTILKIIAGIIRPNQGTVKTKGRISALIELGAGFHPEISGRENIFINGIILGLTKKEIKERYEQIVKFAELEDFIEQPVKTYSSGMFMRLGFSVAINVNPDILIVDEVLAVGDASFVPKCLDKINEFKRNGKTIVFVSHDLETVARITDETIWMEKGKVVMRGYPRQVVDSYLQAISEKEENKHKKDKSDTKYPVDNNRWGDRSVEITSVILKDMKGKERYIYSPEEGISIEMEIKAKENKDDFGFGIGILNGEGNVVYGTNTFIEKLMGKKLKRGSHKISFKIPSLKLVNGFYFIDVAVHSKEGTPYDYHHLLHKFRIDSNINDVGVYRPDHEWKFDEGIEFKKI